MFRREQRSGDAQGGTADDGPGVVSQVVSQVVKNAPAREAVAAGTAAREAAREAAEAMESSCHAPAWLEANPGAENGSIAETTAPSWDQAGEPGTASPARLVLRQRNRMQARCMMGCESGWAASLTSTVCQLEIRCRR